MVSLQSCQASPAKRLHGSCHVAHLLDDSLPSVALHLASIQYSSLAQCRRMVYHNVAWFKGSMHDGVAGVQQFRQL